MDKIIRKGRDVTGEKGFPVSYIYFKNRLPNGWRQGESWVSQNTSGFWAERLEDGVRVKLAISKDLEDSKEEREILCLLERAAYVS